MAVVVVVMFGPIIIGCSLRNPSDPFENFDRLWLKPFDCPVKVASTLSCKLFQNFKPKYWTTKWWNFHSPYGAIIQQRINSVACTNVPNIDQVKLNGPKLSSLQSSIILIELCQHVKQEIHTSKRMHGHISFIMISTLKNQIHQDSKVKQKLWNIENWVS